MEDDCILVAAPNRAGRNFALLLVSRGRKVVVLVNNKADEQQAGKLGATGIIRVKTDEEKTWVIPEYAFKCAFIFETSLTLTCRYLQLCRRWTTGPVIVISPHRHPRMIYKGLGATYIIHSATGEVGFLANGLPDNEEE
ncbi:hypothetical protein V3851_09155 [Paenibacillus sp. M1]|uniref:Uncharacterized protein n=1 Tax=Paenibacillus haidiansis TaxID=1574488 RepID=A0ABU7VQJ1_9BACL